MILGMATPSQADDLAQLMQVVIGLFRESDIGQRFRVYRRDIGPFAKQAGCTKEQAQAFAYNGAVLPPRQSLALIGAILDSERFRRQASAEFWAGQVTGPDPVEHDKGAALAALGQLRSDFPAWEVSVSGLDTLGGEGHRLAWHGRLGDVVAHGGTAKELRAKVEGHEAWLESEKQRLERGESWRKAG